MANTKGTKSKVKTEEIAAAKEKTPKYIYGSVTCKLLNVREEPSKLANVAGFLHEGDRVEIDRKKSTEDFYCISKKGKELWVMKDFITLE